MSVGNQLTKTTVDQSITNLAVQLRNVAWGIKNLNSQINGAGNGLAFLESIGYSNTPNVNNPGGISDAQYALNLIGYMNTNSGVYYGSATQTTQFNFDNGLSPVWAGQ